MNVYRAQSAEAFRTMVETMRREGLERLDILDFPEEQALYPIRHACCQVIAAEDNEGVAFYYFVLERNHMMQLETELSRMRMSRAYRMGDRLARVYRKLRRMLRG